MTEIFVGFSMFVVLSSLLTALYGERIFAWFSCFLFVLSFAVATYTVKYTGYAANAELITSKEASLISAIVEGDWIYVFAWPLGEKEPRLVKLKATEENKKAMQEAQEQQAQNQIVVLEMGSGSGSGSGGNGGGATSVEIIPLDKSELAK